MEAPLNSQQMNTFFDDKKKTVWKICVKWRQKRQIVQEFYTGVCVRPNGLILTSYFPRQKLSEILVCGPDEHDYSKAELYDCDNEQGVSLVKKANSSQNFNYITFASETIFYPGKHVYAIVSPREASSSIFLKGHLAYQYNPTSTFDSEFNPKYRQTKWLPGEHVYPKYLGKDVSLLQLAGLGASNECQDRKDHRYLNQFGYEEGRGAPMFDVTGHVIGLVAFQQSGYDFAFHVDQLKSFVFRDRNSHGKSKKRSIPITQSQKDIQRGKKPWGPSSS